MSTRGTPSLPRFAYPVGLRQSHAVDSGIGPSGDVRHHTMDISQPVARTAFYCCVIRADDAVSPRPICGDTFAARFVDEAVRSDLAPMLRLRNPAAGNVARHRLIDDLVRAQLATNPNRRIVLLGAGFDTRAFRLLGGRWFELDDPQLLAFKETRLPAAQAANPLVRIPVTFANDRPERYLADLADTDDALVILEGVSMYLSDETLGALARALIHALPRATLVCDLMTPRFASTFSRQLRTALEGLGAAFGVRTSHPRLPIEAAGYHVRAVHSIVEFGRQKGRVNIPAWVLNTVLRSLRDGYCVWVFAP